MDASWVSPGTYVAAPKPPIGLAVTSMVCGIVSLLGWCLCFWPLELVGIVVGTVAVMLGVISQIKRRGGTGMAAAGVILGAVGALVSLAMMTIVTSYRWRAFTASPATPTPPATVGAGVPPTGGSAPAHDSAARETPTVMSGQQVSDALIGPLELPADADQAEMELHTALKTYPLCGEGEPKSYEEAFMLYRCVQSFRRYLARSGLSVPVDAEHAEMFRTAGDELIDLVLADYRKAGQFEQDGDWAKAEKAYGKMLEYLPDSGGLVAENVRSRRDWCKYRRRKAENEAKEPGVYQSEE